MTGRSSRLEVLISFGQFKLPRAINSSTNTCFRNLRVHKFTPNDYFYVHQDLFAGIIKLYNPSRLSKSRRNDEVLTAGTQENTRNWGRVIVSIVRSEGGHTQVRNEQIQRQLRLYNSLRFVRLLMMSCPTLRSEITLRPPASSIIFN